MIHIPEITDDAVRFGLHRGPGGAHGNRTIMLRELTALFDASEPVSSIDELRELVVERNVLLKATASNRREVFARLAGMYGLRLDIPIYRVLRMLWDQDPNERPLLAILVALSRDSLLRATVPVVIEAEVGSVVSARMMEAALPGSQSDIGKASITGHAASSWTQSGHLVGRSNKVRVKVAAGPVSTALALWLGYVCGARGLYLYDTSWTRALDLNAASADVLAVEAFRRGLLDYQRIADVLEIGFDSTSKRTNGVFQWGA